VTPFAQRVEMLALATAGHAAFEINELEKDRPGPSYTAVTLAELRQRHPGAEFFLLIGSDCLPDLPRWYDPARITELARLLVVERPGWPVWSPDELRAALGLAEAAPVHLQAVQTPALALSSSDLRQRAAAGRSLRYLVPRAVECFIEEKRLYRAAEPARPGPGA
jgi:nicotinate-nucleotide adenylyltransferase